MKTIILAKGPHPAEIIKLPPALPVLAQKMGNMRDRVGAMENVPGMTMRGARKTAVRKQHLRLRS